MTLDDVWIGDGGGSWRSVSCSTMPAPTKTVPNTRSHALRALQLLSLVRQVAERLDPSLLEKLALLDSYWSFYDMSEGLEAADLLIGHIAYADDALRILGPSGPVLAASGLHEWVWDAAKGRWDDGYYGDAVHSAAEVVIQKTQVKIG